MRQLPNTGVLALLLMILADSKILCLFDLDKGKYDEGRHQFEIIQKNSVMPRYGQCWTGAVQSIITGCKRLTDVEQTRLALAYLNCFLEVQGREHYVCDIVDDIRMCTEHMNDADRASFATFFTHTQNICYFLEAQIWHENTEKTIHRLSDNSEVVAAQLEESSNLQNKVIQQQNISLHNQNLILDQASSLGSIINTSSENVHGMFKEFKKSTNEQRLLINDIFDKVSILQSTILGEFSWFYSVLYYTMSIIVCYLLTSTHRTNAARFWLFGLMTLNILAERVMQYSSLETNGMFNHTAQADEDAQLYHYQWLCRKVSAMVGLVILVVCVYRYRDINFVNNQLLVEIKKQNVELKILLQGRSRKDKKSVYNTSVCDNVVKTIPEVIDIDTTEYESESVGSDASQRDHHGNQASSPAILCSIATHTDPTYTPHQYDLDSESSYATALTGRSQVSQRSQSSTRSSSLTRELRNLQNSNPFKELSDNMLRWATSGCYNITGKGQESPVASTSEIEKRVTRSRSNSPSPHVYKTNNQLQVPCTKTASPGVKKYFLRQRKSSNSANNPAVVSVSPGCLTKKVKDLEKLTLKNSRLVRNTIVHSEKLTVLNEDEK